MSKMALKTDVLRVYRACLRSARKCPAWEQREMMKTYVRLKFRDQVQLKDETQIRRLLADAKEELEQMEYYHSVYAAKQREKEERDRQMASVVSTLSSEMQSAFVNALCPSCGTEYSPPQAKFCSNCGVKRT
ncbi:hypothetical protein Poli38472_001550 [Pythium oligandrum]|uniref:Complex 1 LYR protein domain-containing protein n=1 Tax=Pythium oligandrum TaxID=41045 RepID=A0A8K1CUC3_PYTOL|nr:hypothetical protein Poli38472_001550 [Pythium oligandrum]|eukprot:TMW69394.1 hypothetical protein Poli38472_001550 [Pythium oligandrum]